jgi:hypothetical protein
MLHSAQCSHIHDTSSAFTHIPRGLQRIRCSPSLIDWVLRSRDLDAETWCSWYDAPADHAYIITQVIVQRKRLPRRPKTTWRCRKKLEVMQAHLKSEAPKLGSPGEAIRYLRGIMVWYQYRRTCKEKRAAREAQTEGQRLALHSRLIKAKKAFYKDLELQKRSDSINMGKSVAPKIHLLPVTAVEVSPTSSKISGETLKGMAYVEASPAPP